MNVEWMNHTGFVVSNMERSLAFYRDQLGLEIERDQILEGEFISELVGYPDAKLHIVYLGLGDMKHSVELIEYLNPRSNAVPLPDRKDIGATHLGIIVDNLDEFYKELSSKEVRFLSPPAIRPNAVYPMAQKGCYMKDPDGNWLELLEQPPAPERTTQ
ncbi:MAG TPA: VOC family protein [Dehalococcoidia bacterium]|nr:VOC family protein [Dehalococcoidia bacterium]